NGSIHPEEAVSLGAKVFTEHLDIFVNLTEEAKDMEVMVETEEDEKEKVMEKTSEELDLSVSSYNCLKRTGINTVKKLSAKTDEKRVSLLRNLASDLIIHERIETTEAKAKELRSSVEKMITLGKRGDLSSRRKAAAFLYDQSASEDETVIQKLFDDIAPRYEDRQGGYTRVLKLGPRRGDGAKMAIIELV